MESNELNLPNIQIWKLSHGLFSKHKQDEFLADSIAVIEENKLGNSNKPETQEYKFINAPIGTLFYLCHGNCPVLIGKFTSEAESFETEKGKVQFQRSYQKLKETKKSDKCDLNKIWTSRGLSTFSEVPKTELKNFQDILLKPYFGIDLVELDKLAESTAMGFNRIYYGPPGTGKTYTLLELLKNEYETDPSTISNDKLHNIFIFEEMKKLTWWQRCVVVLQLLGGKARVQEILEHPYIKPIIMSNPSKNYNSTLWSTLQLHTIHKSITVNVERRNAPLIFDKSKDSSWRLVGDWKDICADLIELVEKIKAGQINISRIKRYSFVTFHQSYGYEEFVEGIRPVLSEVDESDEGSEVKYEIRSGVFKELCNRAREEPEQRFAMVIDEINRGNISKIFGELITLIEPDKRDPMDGNAPPIEIELAYSREKFSVPANIDIIGTMNTADRSLASLDIALRRRFDFVPLLPDVRKVKVPGEEYSAPLADLTIQIKGQTIDVRNILETINKRIEILFDRDHCIGHAYFTSLRNIVSPEDRFTELSNIFQKRIIPLLEEYFFNDLNKIRLVLGDNQKQQNAQFIIELDSSDDLNALFGENHGFDDYSVNKRYSLQLNAFENPTAYIGIYQP